MRIINCVSDIIELRTPDKGVMKFYLEEIGEIKSKVYGKFKSENTIDKIEIFIGDFKVNTLRDSKLLTATVEEGLDWLLNKCQLVESKLKERPLEKLNDYVEIKSAIREIKRMM